MPLRNTLILLVAICAAACIALGIAAATAEDDPPKASAVVKVVLPDGHGSAVHIGKGYVLTAAHVVSGNKTVDVKTSTNATLKAEVLWANETYDVALLRVKDPSRLAFAKLTCRTPKIGEAISSEGHPSKSDFVTVWGKIAGNERPFGPWRSVVVTDIVTVPGQSGSPIFDEKGDVVGVVVGVMIIPAGFSFSLASIGYAVPGSTICPLLAR